MLAISDSNNASPPDGLNPLVLFLLITGLGAALGMQTAYCINPARDLGPRLVTWWAGYGREVWNFRNQYWLWTPASRIVVVKIASWTDENLRMIRSVLLLLAHSLGASCTMPCCTLAPSLLSTGNGPGHGAINAVKHSLPQASTRCRPGRARLEV